MTREMKLGNLTEWILHLALNYFAFTVNQHNVIM